MSGIAGLFYYNLQHSALLETNMFKMLNCMNSGSQQENGLYTDNENISLGFSNSNSIATASLFEKNDFVVCFNGHLNHQKLLFQNDKGLAELSSKYIFELFKEKKQDVPLELEGIYSAAILDKKNKVIHLITDRFGCEFIYYYNDDHCFIFSSEIKPILRILGNSPEVDMDGICSIYSFNTVFNTETPFKHIKLLPHAAKFRVSMESIKKKQYWDYPIDIKHHDEDENSLLNKSIERIQSAVNNTSFGFNNIGVMLSGGLDSRLIASVLAENKSKLKAFTFNFGEKKTNDNLIAEKIANKLNIEFFNMPVEISDPIEQIEKCVLDTDGHWAFFELIPNIREIGKTFPGIALINGFLMDTLFKSSWAFFPNKPVGDIHNALIKKYSSFGDYLAEKLFNQEFTEFFKKSKNKTIQKTIEFLPLGKQTEISLKFYCINRARRSHNLIFKAFRKYLNIILPGTDYQLIDFAFHLPYYLRSNPEFYLKLICNWFPEVSDIPWDRTGKPLKKGLITENVKINKIIFNSKYYTQRLTKGKLDLLNSKSGFNWRFRNDKKFQQSIKDILYDQKTISRGFFNKSGIDKLVKGHIAGKDYAAIFKSIISVEMLYRKFIDYASRG